jgi:hypothetical protein
MLSACQLEHSVCVGLKENMLKGVFMCNLQLWCVYRCLLYHYIKHKVSWQILTGVCVISFSGTPRNFDPIAVQKQVGRDPSKALELDIKGLHRVIVKHLSQVSVLSASERCCKLTSSN